MACGRRTMVCGSARAQNYAINQNPILKNRSFLPFPNLFSETAGYVLITQSISFLTLSPDFPATARGIWPPGLPVAFFGMMSIPGFRDPR